ncbi:hypothetical protein FRC14_004857 [Serendipita sp. 396]|nr:hypothetical protein FRC14_004857 [Serendipita sp. 396]
MPPVVTGLLARKPPSKAKRRIRTVIHVWHLLTAILLFVIFLLCLIDGSFLYALYLLPLVICDITYTLIRLFNKDGKKQTFLSRRQFGIFSHLRFRAFLYQAAAIIPLSQRRPFIVTQVLAIIVWVFGVIMFILGCIAREGDFLDWVQEDETEEDEDGIRLPMSDDEESILDNRTNGARTAEFSDAVRV